MAFGLGDAYVNYRMYFVAMVAAVISGCAADYLNNYDTVTLASGNANNTNSLLSSGTNRRLLPEAAIPAIAD
ncbi:hypothetical protein [Mesorhizobium sp. M8A.F.Ca.ET.142.01.1.1]|nr:hypothetical protein [Mesorhizobium sp. M8A.F.Ca.ET.142.01.1.1]TGT91721.1 hypothetical protein EN804_01210 [Mesorhizobium sp. M8A.F.Ca.ET.161.01.1.1]